MKRGFAGITRRTRSGMRAMHKTDPGTDSTGGHTRRSRRSDRWVLSESRLVLCRLLSGARLNHISEFLSCSLELHQFDSSAEFIWTFTDNGKDVNDELKKLHVPNLKASESTGGQDDRLSINLYKGCIVRADVHCVRQP